MSALVLRVLICGVPAGTLFQDASGRMGFCYDEAYAGIPLSMSMSVSNRTYGQSIVRPYLFGLLPDSEAQRAAIARDFEVRPNNPVTLLSHIGLDCPGGVQFCMPEQTAQAMARSGTYRPLSDHEIAQRLRAIRDDRESSWMGLRESWSLGGNQGKFALALVNNRWCECLGSAPTTHIVKNGVIGFKLEALNEFVCMSTAGRLGIPTAHVSYRQFEDEPALLVERYDRVRTADGRIQRVHQEDLCQALGVMPDKKYASDGGPTTRDVLRLLGTTDHAAANVYSFTRMLFYNYLIGAPDAHAKNYSLLLGAKGAALLAPSYDVASGFAYESVRYHVRSAMTIGGENRFGRVGKGAIRRYAAAAGFDGLGFGSDVCIDLMASLAQSIPPCMGEVFEEAGTQRVKGIDELQDRLLGYVEEHCRTTLAQLS